MQFKIISCLFLILFFLSGSITGSAQLSQKIEQQIVDYFAKELQVSPDKIELKIYHAPSFNEKALQAQRITLKTNQFPVRLGHQTLWLEVWQGQQLQNTHRITLSTSLTLPVLVAQEKLSYGETLSAQKVALQPVKVSANLSQYFRETDFEAEWICKQLIRKGEPITKAMLKHKPDIQRGEKVAVHLISGNIIIKTRGWVRQDGVIGDPVPVMIETSRRQMQGQLKSPELVQVEL